MEPNNDHQVNASRSNASITDVSRSDDSVSHVAYSSASILIVEDDHDLAELIQMHLKFLGHQVQLAQSKQVAIEQHREHHFDLIVLDRGLPDGDGLDVCHTLRRFNDWTPVLMLTARDSELDKVEGLEAGVDDYITKPFSVLEFQARVRNTLRRLQQNESKNTPTQNANQLQFGPLLIEPERHQVSIDNEQVTLTATEFSLLTFLASKPGRVYSKDELLTHVWDTNHSGYHHTVCSTVNRLRSKLTLKSSQQPSKSQGLSPSKEHKFIQTVWGVGYKFQPIESL